MRKSSTIALILVSFTALAMPADAIDAEPYETREDFNNGYGPLPRIETVCVCEEDAGLDAAEVTATMCDTSVSVLARSYITTDGACAIYGYADLWYEGGGLTDPNLLEDLDEMCKEVNEKCPSISVDVIESTNIQRKNVHGGLEEQKKHSTGKERLSVS